MFFNHDYIIDYNTRLINKNYILYVINKLLIFNNVNNYIINNLYNINDKYIIRIDDYILLINDINNIYSDIFNKQFKSKKINILNYIDNVENDLSSIFKNIEKNINTDVDFLNVFNYNLPNIHLKHLLKNSKHPIIKKIMNIINLNKKQIHNIIGIIDHSHKFKIKNSIFDKGISCSSLKKNDFILYLSDILNLDESQIYNKTIKDLCHLVKIKLFQLELNNKYILYFKFKL